MYGLPSASCGLAGRARQDITGQIGKQMGEFTPLKGNVCVLRNMEHCKTILAVVMC